MPMHRPLLLCGLLLLVPWVAAQERLALRIAGGYTEVEGFVDFDATVTPTIIDPFDPGSVLTLPPADVEIPFPIDDDDVVWEATLSYRLWRNLHLQGGYVDLGRYRTEPVFFGSGGVLFPPPVPILVRPPPSFDPPLRPLPEPGEVIFGAVRRSRLSMEAHAWLLGLEVDHDVSDRLNVYGRAGALRAGFESDGGNPPQMVIRDPDDRTGWIWGVGIQYRVLPRISVGAAFSEYDVKLMELDSYQLTVAVDLL